MNYAQIRQYDIANGEGIRTTLFVSGCNNNCYNCFNKEYQNYTYGNLFDSATEDRILSYLDDDNISGLSVLGGEPLDQDESLYNFLLKVKAAQKNVWLWTGFTYENLSDNQLRLVNKCVDVLVDGRYIDAMRDLRLRFRGSSNQRLIDIKQSAKLGSVVIYNLK